MKRLLLALLRAFGLFSIARWLTRDQLRILCYHGISIGDQHEYNPVLFMRRETFERRLRRIRTQGWRVVDLDTGVRELAADTLAPNTIVITTDDGWTSTFTQAIPLLARYELPSTLYVTTYYAESGKDVFNLVLHYLAWKSRLERVRLSTGYDALDGEYDLQPNFTPAVRRWTEIADRELSAVQRQDLLPLIAQALQVDPIQALADARFRIMDRVQIQDAAKAGVDIQLHTHRHRLPAESFEAMKVEIDDNKSRLDAWVDRSCAHFCYPSGAYTVQQSEWLARLDLRSSTTCDHGFNLSSQHPHRLKRILDRDNWSDVEFDAALSGMGGLLGR